MQIEEMRVQLNTLKLYMNRMEDWVRQAGNMVYEIEERLMDLEDAEFYKKYEAKDSIRILNGAATQTVSPPRHGIDRCSKDDIKLAAFLQEFQKITA